MFTINVDPASKHIWKALLQDDWASRITIAIRKGHMEFGKYLVGEARRSIREDEKTGNYYKLSSKIAKKVGKLYHQASAPGESPANLTGKLAKHTKSKLLGIDLEWGYGSETPYGKFLEMGAKRGKWKIRKRPNILPVSRHSSAEAEIIYQNRISSDIGKWMGY